MKPLQGWTFREGLLDLSELASVDFTWEAAEERPDEDGDKIHAGCFVAEDDFCLLLAR